MQELNYKAVIFDLDGVITQTAKLHSIAWKKMFDEFLGSVKKNSENTSEFTTDDYLKYVDGKPRYDGVFSFLLSRKINLEYGNPNDPCNEKTICGLGNRKNKIFNDILKTEGIQVYQSTLDYIEYLHKNNICIGVASSSKNCKDILEIVGLNKFIGTRVDGVISAEMGLKGKPAPDIFLQAAKNLNVHPYESIVVEDAASGVKAGKEGNFGLILGLARENNTEILYQNGADIVVDDFEKISYSDINNWFTDGLQQSSWQICYKDYIPEKERSREALLTIGNGYIGTRGCMEEMSNSKFHYPGSYIAGVYNKLASQVAGKKIWNEDFVNIPNWLPVNFKIEDGDWFDIDNVTINKIERKLNFKNGVLEKFVLFTDKNGHEVEISSKRLFSMKKMHLAAIQYNIKPLNFDKKISIVSKIDGNIINDGVARYSNLNKNHLVASVTGWELDKLFLEVKTSQSDIRIATSMQHDFYLNNKLIDSELRLYKNSNEVFCTAEFDVKMNETLTVYKKVAIATSKSDDKSNPLDFVKTAVERYQSFENFVEDSESAWSAIWGKVDFKINKNRLSQKLIHLHIYHLAVSMSPNNIGIDASITARGLHGEAYRGHVFWDEIFIIPWYIKHFPGVAKAMLMYRYRRIENAKQNAKKNDSKGAMYPWQSGSTGYEETQIIHLNPINNKWVEDYSSLQRHVSLAIAYNVIQYFANTNDKDFFYHYGLEMVLEICLFWVSISKWDEAKNRFVINNIMGPDEFHEKYPNSEVGGINNNSYTNMLVSWLLQKANHFVNIDIEKSARILNRINLNISEIDSWLNVSKKLFLEINKDGVIAQFENYFELKELDWEKYKQKYGDIARMDRILKSEGVSPNDYKVAKQADLLMIFYLFDKECITEILSNMGYELSNNYLNLNFEYYFHRTSHGSTLSRIVHSKVAYMIGDTELGQKLFDEAIKSDYIDIQGGSTAEGIHTGVMAGTVILAETLFQNTQSLT